MIVSTIGENQGSMNSGIHADTNGLCSGTAVMYVSIKQKESSMNINIHSKWLVTYNIPLDRRMTSFSVTLHF